MQDTQNDLNKRRQEHESILQARARLLPLFGQHQDQLERAGQALLEQYRAVNRKTRSTPTPERFAEIWKLERINAAADLPENLVRRNLNDEIKGAQGLLMQEIAAIHRAFEEAVEGYRQIDDLFPRNKMSRYQSKRRRKSGESAKLALTVALAIATLFAGGFGVYLWASAGRPIIRDAATLCPLDGPSQINVVLIDTSDEVPAPTRKEALSLLTDFAELPT